MDDFSFSAEDLRANREGKFSPAQRTALKRKRRIALIQVCACLILFLGTLGFAYYVLAAPDILDNIHPTVEFVGFAFLLLLGVRIRHMHIGQDLRADSVLAARGPLLMKADPSRWGGRYYKAHIGTAHVKFSEDVFFALIAFQEDDPERRCVIYYTSTSRAILSFEALEGAPIPARTPFQEALARQHAEEVERYGK